MAWNQFEHLVWKNFVENELQSKEKYILAISAGVDSMALLHCFLRLRPKADFKVLHYHHGDGITKEQNLFRNQSLSLVQNAVEAYKKKDFHVEFFTEKSAVLLKSENDYRKARYRFFRTFVTEKAPLAVGHQQDDWVETQLLKMIRGTGVKSLTNFQMWNGKVFRPFLNLSKSQIVQYATDQHVEWIEDPSNQDNRYLRNWLRNRWLPELEKRKSGAVKNISHSLQSLIETQKHSQTFELCFYNNNQTHGLDRNWYDFLSGKQQLQALHSYFKLCSDLDVTLRQLKEIQKRLDKNQKNLIFSIAGANWVINASQIMIQF